MSVTLYSVTFKKAYSPNQGPCSQSGESAAFEAEPAIQLVAQGYAAFVSSDDGQRSPIRFWRQRQRR